MVSCFNEYTSFKRDNIEECLEHKFKIIDCKVNFLKLLNLN